MEVAWLFCSASPFRFPLPRPAPRSSCPRTAKLFPTSPLNCKQLQTAPFIFLCSLLLLGCFQCSQASSPVTATSTAPSEFLVFPTYCFHGIGDQLHGVSSGTPLIHQFLQLCQNVMRSAYCTAAGMDMLHVFSSPVMHCLGPGGYNKGVEMIGPRLYSQLRHFLKCDALD